MGRRRSDAGASAGSAQAVDSTEIVAALLELDPEVRLEADHGERSLFYNPGGVAPLGVIFASLKDDDGS